MHPPHCPFGSAPPLAVLTKGTRRAQPRRITREGWSYRVLAKGTICRKLNLVLVCARQVGLNRNAGRDAVPGYKTAVYMLRPIIPILRGIYCKQYPLSSWQPIPPRFFLNPCLSEALSERTRY